MIKKSHISIFIFIFLVTYSWAYALSGNQKWAILDNFKKRQYELLFESNLWNISSEFGEIFDIWKKINIYENISDKAESQRKEVEEKNRAIIEKISSLQESITQLDLDISNALMRVKKINENVIVTKNEIKVNKKTIEELNKKISENMELLLEYLIYIYKKWNTVYEDKEIDNLKSILLNEENIWDIINDLYFNWIIQVTWKNIIDQYKKNINELYLSKVSLEKQEQDLKKLRQMWMLEKKVLDDKKSFKERILNVSKWQQSLYEKYVSDKLAIEKALQLKTFKEKIKFNSVRNDILSKYDCEFVDLSKNTIESRALTWKCLDINKMIYSESKLDKVDDENKNFFDWPIEPNRWISAYFRDPWYTKMFWSEHEAIDIVANQWTIIKAPADWYVIYINRPNTQDYAYMALKHYNWYITVYWHISSVYVEEFEYVKKWQIFAQSWWEFGTLWAWYLSTWPHLHFEVFKDKEYVDPLSVLNLSYIQYEKLPEKYRFKYYNDFKEKKWYEFKDKSNNSKTFKLEWVDEIERQKYLIKKYAIWDFNNWQMWVDESLAWNVDPSFVMCVWLAESWLWKNLKTPYNIWNIWNTDSWATITFPNARSWLYSMVKAFNNKYLWQYNEVRQLSRYWNKDPKKPIYASSPDNWHNNVIKCLSHLKWDYIPDDYNFRWIK